jgi:hypothetical protein
MARFVQADFPVEHAGVTRFVNGFAAVRRLYTTRFILHVLALIGAPVTAAGARVRAAFAARAAARKERREDEKLWNIALSDARVMADLSRAMSRDALRDTRGYF